MQLLKTMPRKDLALQYIAIGRETPNACKASMDDEKAMHKQSAGVPPILHVLRSEHASICPHTSNTVFVADWLRTWADLEMNMLPTAQISGSSTSHAHSPAVEAAPLIPPSIPHLAASSRALRKAQLRSTPVIQKWMLQMEPT